ncbi:hypothetical protein EYF80_007607 [Liparis tanakae]|uniref:Uncharacterized protein n=1 Tax=Liparis tanakae TaxID=230148 RepID=A0A4Z2IW78_9TELE|nr:hypothetical protein EYF80_007607 [Liparis tanakae]
MDRALFLLSFSMDRGVANLEPEGEQRAERAEGGMGQKQIKNPKAINQTANQTRALRCGTGRNRGAEDEDRMFSPFLHPKTSTFKHSSFTRLLHHPLPPHTS